MEWVAYALWCFAVAAAGGLVGLVLGNLRLPATLPLSSTVAAGTGANLLISAAAAGTATVAHLRAGRIDRRLFAWMAGPSVVGALIGGYVSGVLPRRVLLGFIALVLAHAAFELFRWKPRADQSSVTGSAAPGADGTTEDSLAFDRRAAGLIGFVVGVLGGIVGLILGSLRMPAMIRWVGVPAARAAGTNVAVGLLVGIFGAIGHLPSEAPDWEVAAVGAAASIPGAAIGARLTGRLSEAQLVRALAWIVVVVAVATAASAVA